MSRNTGTPFCHHCDLWIEWLLYHLIISRADEEGKGFTRAATIQSRYTRADFGLYSGQFDECLPREQAMPWPSRWSRICSVVVVSVVE